MKRRLAGRVGERSADLGHADRQHSVRDVRVGPYLVQEFLLRDEVTAMLDEDAQDVERFRIQVDRA
jgi:hypothetical protein